MIDHMTLGVTDFARAVTFYDAALAPLGICRVMTLPLDQTEGVHVTGYGREQPILWLARERPTTGLLHVAFQAATRADVDAFHAAGLDAGGTDNGAPGLRPHYHADYYAAFLRDPNGHNIEAVCHSPQLTGRT
ncbi:VOC family protein [uncultured Tateyamaria sp.]|uniref:VOC family protein n=1 Tax=uncultured Tateyamaria sp. TaxID=455651 RepID=UPI00261DD390|nr:VOC family protein [uncultured Tateyamaria sp.]